MKGAQAFETHYLSIYGERWESLKGALLAPKKHVVVFPADLGFTYEELPERREFPGVRCYFMDRASLLPVMALELAPTEHVLDLCAAPGGKSLLMAWSLAQNGKLVANDRSPDRRGRLRKTLEELTLPEKRPELQVTGHEAQRWGLHQQNAFDKVLLDAPCSSERHVLEDSKELASWSIKRPQRLATEQFAMLCSALEALKPGGTMVYSTCALEPRENDGVVEKLLERRAGRVELLPWQSPLGEATSCGWRVLPDQGGWGPFYLARLRKIS